jgi:hypothetical protein
MTIRPAEAAWLMLLLASGCAAGQPGLLRGLPPAEEFEGRCALAAKPSHGARMAQSSNRLEELEAAPLPPALSSQSREIAQTIGVLNLIKLISALEDRHVQEALAAHVRLLDARQQLSTQIQSALFEVESATAEVRCERERAVQLADLLEESLNRDVKVLTVSAIISGAVFGFASGGLFLAGVTTAGTAVGIAGGVVETVLGALALNDQRSASFQHKRNILREIWVGPEDQKILPDMVWRFLNQPLNEEPRHRSLRDTLILRWRENDGLATDGSDTDRQRTALLFGHGDVYEIDDLRARAAMLSLLEADINLMTQDLNLLMEEVLVRDPRAP